MKRIVFIAHALCDEKIAGVHRYTLEMLKALDKIVTDEQVELLIPASEQNDYHFTNIKIVNMGVKIPLSGSAGIRAERYLAKNIFAPVYAKIRDALTIDFELQFPIFGCDVIAIYDCRVNKFPEYYTISRQQQSFYKALLRHQNRAVQHCKMIVTDSNFAKKEIKEIYGERVKDIQTLYCGWEHFKNVKEDLFILNNLGLTRQGYFFSLGSRFPHKNIKWISCAAKRHPEYQFVISGDVRTRTDFNFEGEKQPNMLFAGRLSDSEVKTLMKNCKAFIQPSLYEGFGIPPLEAMSTGADCIVSDIEVFREVYQNSVWYIDPNDYDHIDLDEIMLRTKDSNEVILNQYSWEKSAQKLLEIFKKL